MNSTPHSEFRFKDCSTCESRAGSLFCTAPKEALEHLNACKINKSFRKGQVLFDAGQVAQGIYCVNSGTICVERISSTGNAFILRIASAGDILGCRALFSGEHYHATAVAKEDCTVCIIPTSAINSLFLEHPSVAVEFLSSLTKELGQGEDRMVALVHKNAQERIAESVLYLKQHHSSQKWTRREIAEWAGTTPETVMRTLSTFEKDGLVELQGRDILIKDKPALVERANISY